MFSDLICCVGYEFFKNTELEMKDSIYQGVKMHKCAINATTCAEVNNYCSGFQTTSA